MLNGHNKVTETFPCWQHCNACKLQHKEKMAHTHTYTDGPPQWECVCRFVHFHFFNRAVCARVCVSEGPFVYIPLTESVPKFAHVTNSIQTNKHTHTHTCIFTYAVKAKVAMRTKTNETKWQREQEGEESLSVLTLIWTIVLPVKLNAFRSGWRKSS